MVLVLHFPSGVVVAVVPGEGLQEGRKAETDDKEVKPDPLLPRDPPEKDESKQCKDQRNRGDILVQDTPEDLAESGEGLKGALLIRCFWPFLLLSRRDPDQFSDRSLELVGKGAPILGTVDRVEEALGRAAVTPVHRWVRRRSQRHVGVGEQTKKHRNEKKKATPPFREFFPDQNEKGQECAHREQ